MAHDKKALSLNVACEPWSDDAQAWLAKVAGHGRVTIEDLHGQVENGAGLFTIRDDESKCHGAYIVRIDQVAKGFEGVIVAASIEVNGVDAIETFLPEIERRFAGCLGIRFHSIRPGLLRKMLTHGYKPDEFVCFKALQ